MRSLFLFRWFLFLAKQILPKKEGSSIKCSVFLRKQKEVYMPSFVYILSNKRNGTLYTGITADLIKRVYQHKSDLVEGFSKKYGVHDLVYYEMYDDITDAIAREKCIKKWRRQWKLNLIEGMNPQWNDLYESLL